MNAIQQREISECHFFALFLASQSSKSGVSEFRQDLAVYQRGMVEVLRVLSDNVQGFRPLQHLHPFLLSFTRRILCRGDFSMPEYLVDDVRTGSNLSAPEMRQVVQRLPIATRLSEIPTSSTLAPEHGQLQTINLHNWDYWNEVDCCLCGEFEEMAEWFQIVINSPGKSEETFKMLEPSIRRTWRKVDNMLNIHDVSYVFECVCYPLLY